MGGGNPNRGHRIRKTIIVLPPFAPEFDSLRALVLGWARTEEQAMHARLGGGKVPLN